MAKKNPKKERPVRETPRLYADVLGLTGLVYPFDYDLKASREYCESIGLHWLGDDFLAEVKKEANKYLFTQDQFDAAMRQHLWQVKFLFDPASYDWRGRTALAIYFLTGWKPKK